MELNKLLINSGNQWLLPIVIATISFLVYAGILIIGVPQQISFISTGYGLSISLPAFIIVAFSLYLAYRQPGWIGTLISLCLTLGLFALPLSGLWSTGTTHGYAIGGLLPVSDAAGYYSSALRVLDGDPAITVSSKRPWFIGFLAALLGLTQQNLQVTLAIFVLINAIACFFLAREVQRSHGTAAGVLVLVLMFLFCRGFIGTTMTENLGVPMATVALAILWRGATKSNFNLSLWGIFLLTMALNIRVGALFVLPALVLWGAWLFRGSSRFSWRFLLGGFSLVLLGFMLNSIIVKLIGSPKAMGNENFAFHVYAMVVQDDWLSIFRNHPEVTKLVGQEQAQRIYALAWEAFRENPFGIFRSIVRAWQYFIFNDFVFSFIGNIKLNFSLQIFSIIAVVNCFRKYQRPTSSLMLAAMIGILASVPFVPPWDGGIRPYAATVPFFCIFPALGLALVAEKMAWQQLIKVPRQKYQNKTFLIFSIVLSLFSIVAPITTKLLSHTPKIADLSCPGGMELIYLYNSPGSSINLINKKYPPEEDIPNALKVPMKTFKENMDQLESISARAIVAKQFGQLSSNTIIRNLKMEDGIEDFYLMTDSKLVPRKTGRVGVCGTRKVISDPKRYDLNYHFFYANSMFLVE